MHTVDSLETSTQTSTSKDDGSDKDPIHGVVVFDSTEADIIKHIDLGGLMSTECGKQIIPAPLEKQEITCEKCGETPFDYKLDEKSKPFHIVCVSEKKET